MAVSAVFLIIEIIIAPMIVEDYSMDSLPRSKGEYVLMLVQCLLGIVAMLLPGISGAFVLVLLGQYQFVLTAVTTFNLPVLVLFALGCVCGLLLFARVLNYCLRRYRTATLAILIGIMAGSLRTVWPWQEANMPALPNLHA